MDALPGALGAALNTTLRVLLGGAQVERAVRALQPIVDRVNEFGLQMRRLSDKDLAAKTDEFRQRLAKGETLDDLMAEAFAVVREASARTIGLRHFDVQILGGIVLYKGKIAEMVTGEGKTLVATLPAYLHALSGHPIHIVTVNDYLAQRDRDWMGPVYEFLGLTCGVIYSGMDEMERLRAYRCSVTYGTNSEFGFDYLRKNLESRAEYQVQGELSFAIVDEVDSVLIDEARVPLIISAPSGIDSGKMYSVVKRIVDELRPGIDYTVDEKNKTVTLTEVGLSAIEEASHRGIYESENIEWPHYVEQAIRARDLYKENRDYVIQDGKVIIVDQFTGRLQHGRRWSDWLHEAIEAKHGLPVGQEQRTVATITYQNFFRLYKKLAGMTGTAMTQAEEFMKIYGLEVVPIPTHMPLRRVSFPDLVYRAEQEKIDAVVEEIVRYNRGGRPVLVGTTSVEKSAQLSEALKKLNIPHEVLNAKNHAREAEIIAKAGQAGAVTIATNMAGRGTDIVLGPGVVKCRGLAPDDPLVPENCLRHRRPRSGERDVCCGLHVIGTERHEARRIDDQLRGRAGRQGDPGSSRFFLSLEDDLMRLFMGDWTRRFLQNSAIPPGQPIESGMVTRSIRRAQAKVEERNFEMRKRLVEYDELMDERRKDIYGDRQKLVEGGDEHSIEQLVDDLLARHIDAKWAKASDEQYVRERNYRPLAEALAPFGVAVSFDDWKRCTVEELLAQVRKVTSSADVTARASEQVRPWLERCVARWTPDDAFPTEWSYEGIGRLLTGVGFERRPREELEILVLGSVVRAVVDAFGESVKNRPSEDVVKDWVERAIEMDALLACGSPEWDIHGLEKYCQVLEIDFFASELSGRVQHLDRIAEFLQERILKASWARDGGELHRKLVNIAVWPYLASGLFRRSPSYEHLMHYVEHRFGIPIAPAVLTEAGKRGRDVLVMLALEERAAEWVAGRDIERLLEVVVIEALRSDLSAPDRDLDGLLRECPELVRTHGLSAFALAKLSYRELWETLLAAAGRLARRNDNPIGVQPHLLGALENAIEVTVERLISEKTADALADECYADASAWAAKLGLSLPRTEWDALSEAELAHHLAIDALDAWADESVESIVRRTFSTAFDEKVDAPGYAATASYAELGAWGTRWTGDMAHPQTGVDSERLDAERRRALEARLRLRRQSLVEQARENERRLLGHIEQTFREILKSLSTQLQEVVAEHTDDAAEQTDRLVDWALNAFESSVESADELPFDQLSAWLAEHFRVRARLTDLQEAVFGSGTTLREFVASRLRPGSSGGRAIASLAESTARAVLALFANPKECCFGWDLEKLERWAARAGVAFSADEVNEQLRNRVREFFLSAVLRRYEGASRRAIIFETVRHAFESFLEVSLSTEGRNVRGLADHLAREYQLYGIAAAVESQRRMNEAVERGIATETDESAVDTGQAPASGEPDAARISDILRAWRLAPAAPRYGLGALDLARTSGDALLRRILDTSRRLVVEARTMMPEQVAALGGESLLSRTRTLLIHTIDERWIEYVHQMHALQEGIGFRGYAGVDPKVAYKKEGAEMFLKMVVEAKENFARQFGWTVRRALEGQVSYVSRAIEQVVARQTPISSAYEQQQRMLAQARAAARAAGQGEQDRPEPLRAEKEPGRNDPCPCGAKDKHGRPIKYKKCHGRRT